MQLCNVQLAANLKGTPPPPPLMIQEYSSEVL